MEKLVKLQCNDCIGVGVVYHQHILGPDFDFDHICDRCHGTGFVVTQIQDGELANIILSHYGQDVKEEKADEVRPPQG